MRARGRTSLFFGLVFLLSLFQTRWALGIVAFEPGSLFAYLWMAAFSFLALNISILAAQSLFGLFVRTPVFRKAAKPEIASLPVALFYCIRNESFGLRERIRYTLQGNLLPKLYLWILSDSDETREDEEREIVEALGGEFGKERVFYRRRVSPRERKQGNIKEWLTEHGSDYKYFIICDADSLLPAGWAEEALQIAEHPDHERIGIFQSSVYVTHEASFYSRMQAIGQFYAQQLYFRVNQAVFGRSISFGHNQLIRKEAFEKIELPEGILSHDNWDTALLEKEGYRTVFVPDLISFEEAPAHYLEERRRAKRWLKGSLQGWPLVFLPQISFSTRFLIFYQIYLYFVQPVLFFWIVSGLIAAGSLRDQLFTSGKDSLGLLGFSLGILFTHRWVVARSAGDLLRIVSETVFSTLVGLQNIFYGTLDFLILPLERLGWTPMAKNPSEQPPLGECLQSLSAGTVAGGVALWMGLETSWAWTAFTLPVIASLLLSIPSVYFSAKRWSPKGEANAVSGGKSEPNLALPVRELEAVGANL